MNETHTLPRGTCEMYINRPFCRTKEMMEKTKKEMKS